MREMAESNQQIRAKPVNLLRVANRHRQALRPADPKPGDLDFELERDFINAENFLVDDINTMGARHLLFATSEQLQHLARARRWFIDGTFRVVSRPFHQLMTIHAFVKKGDDIKQVPLLFVLMSRRQKRDYVAVFQAIIQRFQPEELLPLTKLLIGVRDIKPITGAPNLMCTLNQSLCNKTVPMPCSMRLGGLQKPANPIFVRLERREK